MKQCTVSEKIRKKRMWGKGRGKERRASYEELRSVLGTGQKSWEKPNTMDRLLRKILNSKMQS